jgi:hypothetical protein
MNGDTGCFAPTLDHDDAMDVIRHYDPSSNTTQEKWWGMACQQAAAMVPKGFNRISPPTISPNRHALSRVQIVTKYAPAWQG